MPRTSHGLNLVVKAYSSLLLQYKQTQTYRHSNSCRRG